MIRLKSEHATRRAIAEEPCRVAGTKLQRDCYGKVQLRIEQLFNRGVIPLR